MRRLRIDRAYAARDVDDEAAGDSDGADAAGEDDAPADDAGEDEGGDDAPAGDEPSNVKYRDITADAAVGLDSGKAGGDGGWQ
ncbi:MAG: hypothetical protein LBU21_06380 [Treponema sp.]|nr:hypothetical protein [Treponema sp.]